MICRYFLIVALSTSFSKCHFVTFALLPCIHFMRLIVTFCLKHRAIIYFRTETFLVCFGANKTSMKWDGQREIAETFMRANTRILRREVRLSLAQRNVVNGRRAHASRGVECHGFDSENCNACHRIRSYGAGGLTRYGALFCDIILFVMSKYFARKILFLVQFN